MFKVTYKYLQTYPSGGRGEIITKLQLYDANNAKELQEQIDGFLNDNKNGYRTNIVVISVERL